MQNLAADNKYYQENATELDKDKTHANFFYLIQGKTINDFSGWKIAVAQAPDSSSLKYSASVFLLKPNN